MSEDVSVTSGQVIWASFTDSATQYQFSRAFQIVYSWAQTTVLHIWKNTQKQAGGFFILEKFLLKCLLLTSSIYSAKLLNRFLIAHSYMIHEGQQ